ncbi:hypothetical protein BH11VER1_BH11VER1_10830 [soil metagenome]
MIKIQKVNFTTPYSEMLDRKRPLYFLSEMTVSAQHGGGITLFRTLSPELNDFDIFFSIGDYYLPAPSVAERTHKWRPWTSSSICKRVLGCRLSYYLETRNWLQRRYARRSAMLIHKTLGTTSDDVCFLVCPQGSLAMRTIAELKRLRNVKYITWVMDDYYVRRDAANTWIYPVQEEQIFARHLRDAQVVLTISRPMGEFYKTRFGIKYDVLFAPTPRDAPPPSGDHVPSYRLGYFGNLYEWVTDALARLRPYTAAAGYEIVIYSHQALPDTLKAPGITLMPPLSANVVQDKMLEFDAVLLPIGFTPQVQGFACFNIATKMAECIASGTVTLAIGPADSAMIRYMRDEGVGLPLSDLSASEVSSTLQVLNNPISRVQMLQRAVEHANTKLNKRSTLEKWESALKTLNRSMPSNV